MMYEWMRDFCRAHFFKINAAKSRYVISDYQGPKDKRWLFSVDGKEKIKPLPSTHQFRYLGLWMSMDLDWSNQVRVLNGLEMESRGC
jgi:hypothetical protein